MRQRGFFPPPWVNSEKAVGVQRKGEGGQHGEKGRVINSGGSSGSGSIVGAAGQASAALMALPDARRDPRPPPG